MARSGGLWYSQPMNQENGIAATKPAGKYQDPVRWDGKDFSAIQMATGWIPRTHGQPAAQVDGGWNLFIHGRPVPVDSYILVGESGQVTIAETIAETGAVAIEASGESSGQNN
jgi:hypothetical protein